MSLFTITSVILSTLALSCHGEAEIAPQRVEIAPPNVEIAPPNVEISSDAFVDLLLAAVDKAILDGGLDPMMLPTECVGFSQNILGILWHGEACFENGRLEGLSTFTRTGSTEFRLPTFTNPTLGLDANIGVASIAAHYEGRVEFMDIGVSAGATVKVDGASIFFTSDMCIGEGCHLILDKFEVTVGHISVDIDFIGIFDWIIEIVVNFLVNLVRDLVVNLLEGTIKGIIQDVLDGLVPDVPDATTASPIAIAGFAHAESDNTLLKVATNMNAKPIKN